MILWKSESRLKKYWFIFVGGREGVSSDLPMTMTLQHEFTPSIVVDLALAHMLSYGTFESLICIKRCLHKVFERFLM